MELTWQKRMKLPPKANKMWGILSLRDIPETLYWKMPDARGGRGQARSSIQMLVYSLDADRPHSQMIMFPKQPPKSTRRFYFWRVGNGKAQFRGHQAYKRAGIGSRYRAKTRDLKWEPTDPVEGSQPSSPTQILENLKLEIQIQRQEAGRFYTWRPK